MTPAELKAYLNNLVSQNLQISTTIWGSPGIGKSSIVAQIAQEHCIDFARSKYSSHSRARTNLHYPLSVLDEFLPTNTFVAIG